MNLKDNSKIDFNIEYLSVHLVLTLNVNLPLLIEKLALNGFATAKLIPDFDGYNLQLIQPGNIIAFNQSVKLAYDFSRRLLRIVGMNSNELLLAFKDLINILREISPQFNSNVLIYELLFRGTTRLNYPTSEIDTKDILGFSLEELPTMYILKNGNPSSKKWFNLEIKPVWPTYTPYDTLSEIKIVYRDTLENILSFLKDFETKVGELIYRVTSQ